MEADERPVVVVEDDHDIRALIGEILDEEEYEPICLPDPTSVVEVAEEQRPALFLVDLMLPGATGIEVAKELRDDGAPDTPIIGMSASEAMLQRAKATRLFTAFLHKPFDLSDLLTCIDRCLRRTRASPPAR